MKKLRINLIFLLFIKIYGLPIIFKINEYSKISVNGILKYQENILENNNLFVKFSSFDLNFTNQLCTKFGYDSIHSVLYPCTFETNQKFVIQIIATSSCCQLYKKFHIDLFCFF